jgi:hypothetical protein
MSVNRVLMADDNPVMANLLKEAERIAEMAGEPLVERRSEPRIRMQVMIKLRGTDRFGKAFHELTVTDDVSAGGFRCCCTMPLDTKAVVEVYSTGGGKMRRVGCAQVAHVRWPGTAAQQYGFQFLQKPTEWVV